jgi:tetratricopeptide (TPR) repeat protein
VSAGQGVQVGDHNTQHNYFFGDAPALPGVAAARTVVAGDIPQEPAAFQSRAALMETLSQERGGRVRVVFALTGIRGVGKTQVAAAYARQKINAKWRLVAWVDASNETSLLAGLAQVAVEAGVGPAGEDAQVLAGRVRHLLEADGDRRLLVFDNAVDLDLLRPFVPAGGAAQVVITSSRRSAVGLGELVPVDVFSEGEALAFLAERTGLGDVAGARELAVELGFLPLGLGQAAALIAREHLDYGTYLGRLRSLSVADYLGRAEGDVYPYRLAEAVILSLRAVEDHDPSGVRGSLMGLVAVLAESGVPRRLLHLAAADGIFGSVQTTAAGADAGIGDLVDASLLGFTVEGTSVVAHRLVMRVARERLAAEDRLPAALDGAVEVLAGMADGYGEAWRDHAGVRDLARQVGAVMACTVIHPDVFAERMPAGLLGLRLRSVYLLNLLGDGSGLAIDAAEPLVTECEQVLGADHPDTLMSRNNLAMAYHYAGRTAKAIPLYERILAERERLLGTDHADTLESRNNLAMAYHDAGRTTEAMPLLERTLANRERVLGADHPDTLMSRNNLAMAYYDAGRTGKATPLYELTLADSERVLGADHPDTLMSRNNLAMAYQNAGRTTEAVPLLERTLADSERVLGTDHANTLSSRNNLAMAYLTAERTAEAIPLLERTLADSERLLDSDHPNTLGTRNNLAMAYHNAGRTAEAVPVLKRTLADCERLLGRDHPNTVGVRENLAALTN